MTDDMTLRDVFALHAPVTLADAALACGWTGLIDAHLTQDSHRVTLWCVLSLLRYEYADAMLEERARQK